MSELSQKVSALRALLHDLKRVVVCFSGGVDSGYLVAESFAALGKEALALTAVSPSLAPEEGVHAQRLAKEIGVRHLLVETHELDDPRYTANPVNRCYFCKTETYGAAIEHAHGLGVPHVLDGFNLDDRGDHRPGRQAAVEYGVRSPLDELNFTKTDIREAARHIDLPIWDKPALACLSSRVPYGTEITRFKLEQVNDCEQVLHTNGFRVCRVRHHGAMARIEVLPDEIERLLLPAMREVVVREFRAAGFHQVTVDLQGYRSGSLNEAVLSKDTTMSIVSLTSGS
jgi:uncharacterized protein